MKKSLRMVAVLWSIILIAEICGLYGITLAFKANSSLLILYNANMVVGSVLCVLVIAIEIYQICFTFPKVSQRFTYHKIVDQVGELLVTSMSLLACLSAICLLLAFLPFSFSIVITAILFLVGSVAMIPLAVKLIKEP